MQGVRCAQCRGEMKKLNEWLYCLDCADAHDPECSKKVCMLCSMRDCPNSDSVHYAAEGCPSCDMPVGCESGSVIPIEHGVFLPPVQTVTTTSVQICAPMPTYPPACNQLLLAVTAPTP